MTLIKKRLLRVKSNKRTFKPNDYSLPNPRSSHRPTKTPHSSSVRPTTGSSHRPTFANTYLKNTQQQIVCCSCKDFISETILFHDADGIEYRGCPACQSDLVIDFSKGSIGIDAESVINLLRKHDANEVFSAIDVISHKQRTGERVANSTGLLIHMLKHGVIFPESYMPPAERRKRDAYLKMQKAKEDAEKKKEEAEYLAKQLKAEKLYNSLTAKEKDALRERARAELPSVLHGFKQCIGAKMIELLTRADENHKKSEVSL